MDQALLLFAKVPRPGSVKTRLTPVLSHAEAARLYSAFLRDTLRHMRSVDADVFLYLAPPLPDDGLTGVPTDVTVSEQEGESLGSRMARAFKETLAEGYDRALVLGTDHPTLPSSFVRQALGALQRPRSLCLGPTEDGGFYLMGMSAFYPQLFEDMTYSHPRVFSETLARSSRTDAQLTVLPRWYDVDTPPDLDRMRTDLREGRVDCPNTHRVMERLGLSSTP